MPDDITLNGLPDDGNSSVAGGAASVGGAELLDLSELNQLLGKNFPTKEAAMKSIKDTFSYTGQVGQLRAQLQALQSGQQPQATAGQDSELTSTVKALQTELEEQRFVTERPELKDYLPTLRELRNSTGKTLNELLNNEALRPLFEKSLAQDAVQKKRSVLESNPRLGQLRNKTQEAKDALKEGNHNLARETAVSAVLDAYDLGG